VCVAPQQVAGGEIADRQREAVVSVLQSKLSFVVGGPPVLAPQVQANIVGALWLGLGTPGMGPPIAPPGLDQPFS